MEEQREAFIEAVAQGNETKVNYIHTYFTVPDALQAKVGAFAQAVNRLGEACQGATDFEAYFVPSGLSEQFMAILQQCTQKPRKMTKEEKQKSFEITKNILKDNKKEIAKDVAASVATRVSTELRSELATQRREQMVKDGTYTDYNIARNRAANICFLARLFGKKIRQNEADDT